MREVMLQQWEGVEGGGQLDVILPVYEEVYAEPPYLEGPREVADFIERYQQEITLPEFRLRVARRGKEVVGFAFGFCLPPDTTWWAGSFTELSADFTQETGRRTFAVIELAVRKPWRRQGIATRLHAALTAGLNVERITLTMRPEPEVEPARTAYAAWGYRTIGQSRPWAEAPVYDLLVRWPS